MIHDGINQNLILCKYKRQSLSLKEQFWYLVA